MQIRRFYAMSLIFPPTNRASSDCGIKILILIKFSCPVDYSMKSNSSLFQECLFSALVEENYKSASAILFVMDRFIYWQGLSKTGLKVAKYIEKKSPNTAIAPQIVIRKVRVMKNNGDIQGISFLNASLVFLLT